MPFKKNNIPWNKGNINPKAYSSIHSWMNKIFDTPRFCEICKSVNAKRYEWSNISGKYLLIRGDWQRLCASCHKRIDYTDLRKNKMSIALKGNKNGLGYKHSIDAKLKISKASKKMWESRI